MRARFRLGSFRMIAYFSLYFAITIVDCNTANATENLRVLKQITGRSGQPSGIDFGDPSAPDFSTPGEVRVYTTGGEMLTWKDSATESAKLKFLRGKPAHHSKLPLYHNDGLTALDPIGAGEDAWDPTVEPGGLLYAGVMTKRAGATNAFWPDDHWNRRTFLFRKKNDRWVMEKESVFGQVPAAFNWIGHNYGHHFLKDERGRGFMFYEKVSAEENGRPTKTEIFARQLVTPDRLGGPEISILTFQDHIWPKAIRDDGTYLVEGPRPFRFEDKYLLTFSAGDYFSRSYGIHMMWADRATGPYRPYLTPSGRDLKNFGAAIERRLKLTWGAGRAVFFEMDIVDAAADSAADSAKEWWVLFHGVPEQSGQPEGPSELTRDLFLAPVEIRVPASGVPELSIRP